jgi:CHAD domain-containing protein
MFEEHPLKKVIAEYLFRNLDLFNSNLDKAQRVYDPEAIHDYRVAVKRIRAVVRAVDRCGENIVFPEDMIVPLRLMFKAGGTIRDDQVQIGLVESIEEKYTQQFKLIKEFYRQKIKIQRDGFFVRSFEMEPGDINQIKEEVQNALEPLDETELGINLKNWLSDGMLKLKRKRYDLDTPELLHKFRTRYKQNGYIVEMIYQSKYDLRITKKFYGIMKAFGQELGNWHDYFQLLANTAIIFRESRNNQLLEEAFELRKLINPLHDKIMQEILHQIKRDDSLFDI